MEEQEAKILFYDLEVCRDIVEGYGNKWEFKVVKWVRHQELMCYSYKWAGDKKPTFVYRHQFDTMKQFVTSLRNLLHESNIAVAHNGKKFDNRMSNRFFIKNDVKLPSPFFSVDTLQVARSKFKFPGNSLNDLCEYLGIGAKENITYKDLEDDFMTNNPSPKTIRLMKKYNNMDVELLEKLYYKLLPYITNHPNLARITNRPEACPKCGVEDMWESAGWRTTTSQRYRRYRCKNCGGYASRSRAVGKDQDVKPSFVNYSHA